VAGVGVLHGILDQTLRDHREFDVFGLTDPLKVVAAAIAAGAMVTMGALTVALNGVEAHAVTAISEGAGDTFTSAPSTNTPPVPKATPAVKAPKWHGNGWPGQ